MAKVSENFLWQITIIRDGKQIFSFAPNKEDAKNWPSFHLKKKSEFCWSCRGYPVVCETTKERGNVATGISLHSAKPMAKKRFSPSPFILRYSYRSASIGFANAALIACALTAASAITNANPPANTKTHQPISIR